MYEDTHVGFDTNWRVIREEVNNINDSCTCSCRAIIKTSPAPLSLCFPTPLSPSVHLIPCPSIPPFLAALTQYVD